jgi:hypothetical protein
MGKASTKHFNQRKIPLPAFPLGLDWSQPAEMIADGALQDAKNAEYNHVTGALRTAAGNKVKQNYGASPAIYGNTSEIHNNTTSIYAYDLNVHSLYYDRIHDTYLFNDGNQLYKTNLTNSVTLVGTLTGSETPIYDEFKDDIAIASGGKLQYFDGTTLTTALDSPLCTYVASLYGRVLVFGYDDRIDESGIGDITNWTNVPSDPSSAQFIYIGEDGRKVLAVDVLGSDLIVYKDGGKVYRRTGITAADWEVREISRKAYCENKHCAVSVGNNAYFFGKEGFKSLANVVEYGDVKQQDAGVAINGRITSDSTAKMWLVEPKRQIWIKPINSTRVFMYHYTTGAFTYRDFKTALTAVITKGTDVFIAFGNKIAQLDPTSDRDDGQQIVTVVKSKRYIPPRLYTILKYTKFQAQVVRSGDGMLQIGETKIPLIFASGSDKIFGNNALIYGNKTKIKTSAFANIAEYGGGSNEYLEVELTVAQGSIEWRSLDIEIAEV